MARIIIFLFGMFFSVSASAQSEVMYHVSQRSFFDSNGDSVGDLKGMNQKLEYLQRLGITTIVLDPIYESDFYHNRFANNFEAVDKEFGSLAEYTALVTEVHRKKMKIYQTVDMQYVSAKHIWFHNSYDNPLSEAPGYIFYKDPQNKQLYYFLDNPELITYNNSKEKVVAVNMKDTDFKDYAVKILKYWMDPNNDGNFADGVDGYVVRNMADSSVGQTTGLLKEFWAPVINGLKTLNPQISIMAEPDDAKADITKYLIVTNADGVYANALQEAIASFDKKRIVATAQATFFNVPAGRQPIVFIEGPENDRFASGTDMDMGKLKVGAALNILMGGVPIINYGQEIGMGGKLGKGKTDGTGIPVREAFEWYATGEGLGMANWYKDTGEWWTNRYAKANDGISAEEQMKDTNSLWSYYKSLIRIRKMQPAMVLGNYRTVPNTNDNVVSFVKTAGEDDILVMINLSAQRQIASLDDDTLALDVLRLLSGTPNVSFPKGGRTLTLTPYAVQVWQIPAKTKPLIQE